MKVPFADLTRDEQESFIGDSELQAVIKANIEDVISRKNFVLGDYVDKFEKDFASYCGTKHCVGVSSGLAALELSMIGLGIDEGDEVITPANTFNATVAAIAKSGAIPVLVDVNEIDYNLSPELIEIALTSKTKAILSVHLYGQTADLNELEKIAEKQDVYLIEDACQAHGALLNGKKAGSLGIAGCFSFFPGKNLGGYGDGGAITTSDDNLAEFLRKSRNYGQSKKYCHDTRPDNSRLDTIQAAVLIEKLKILDKWNFWRAIHAEQYRDKLRGVEEIVLPEERKRGEHIYHLFVVQAKRRDELEKYLAERGVQAGKHYPIPIHLQKCFENLGYQKGDFPIAEKLADRILSLPMFPTLREAEIDYVAESIKEFYKR